MALGASLVLSAALAGSAQVPAAPAENLGKVDFPVSCAKAVRAPFNRGVALLHDFWYDEAKRQFQKIAKADASCAMAHWGIAISTYHQIWDRPDEDVLAQGWVEIRTAMAPAAKTGRERAYVAALGGFFKPGQKDYQARVDAYSDAMAELYRRFPGDVDAGAFYALSLLAAERPDDTSLTQQHRALAVLNPLFAKNPDHPGLVHYIIHACDTPSLAAQGLAAARRYADIASSGAHAVHMPGHIFARLGLWQDDIRDNLASVEASKAAEGRRESDGMDQFHSDDFLVYAFLQAGEEARAKKIVDDTPGVMSRYEAMPEMTSPFMREMFPYYRNKFPAFYDLEIRDWTAAAALEPAPSDQPDNSLVTYWARVVADGHLRHPQQAHADFERHEALVDEMKRGKSAYAAESTGARISHEELLAWVAYADGDQAGALAHMRDASDLQDKVGQGEVDIPAREMLADMLLEMHYAGAALIEYGRALELSPNRFNGLFNAGRAAEEAGDREKAAAYYAALLQSTDNGAHSVRQEFNHVKAFVSSAKVASK